MDFAFTAEQLALRDAARELFAAENPPSRLRELWGGAARDRRLWKQMAAMGITGLRVPEDHGGMGASEVELVLILEEAGRAALPEPVLETVAIATPWVAELGLEEWLPRIASGDAVVSVCFDGQPFVADADDVDLLLLESQGGVTPLERGSFRGTRVDAEDRVRRLSEVHGYADAGKTVPTDTARALARAGWAVAATLNGVSLRLLEMTIEYVKGREQFGRAVGSFQAVKHKLASAHVLVEGARSAAWYAAYALATDASDAARACSVARVTASEAHALVNQEALQCHGGIGFTWEHDLHFWLKRGLSLQATYTVPSRERAHLAEIVLAE